MIEKYDAPLEDYPTSGEALDGGLFRLFDYMVDKNMVDLNRYRNYAESYAKSYNNLPEIVAHLAKHKIILSEYIEDEPTPKSEPVVEEEKKVESIALQKVGDCNPQPVHMDALSPNTLSIVASYVIEKNNGEVGTVHLGDNRVGILSFVGDNFNPVLDVVEGVLLWRAEGILDGDNACVLYDDNAIYVPRVVWGKRFISAHKLETGELLWECKLSNSYKQFGTLLAQTENYIAHANTSNSKLYITSKSKGKLLKRIDMQNAIGKWETAKSIIGWNDHFFVFCYNYDNCLYHIDEYDAASASFVKTLITIKRKKKRTDSDSYLRVVSSIVIGDYLYLLTTDACIRKISLASGDLENETDLPLDSEVPNFLTVSDNYYKESMNQIENKFHLEFRALGGHRYYTYDLVTNEVIGYDLKDALEYYLIHNVSSRKGMVYCFGFGTNGYNNSREMAIYNIEKKEFVAKLILPELDGKNTCSRDDDMFIMNDRKVSHIIVGNSIFVSQIGGERYGEQSTVLHQIR